MSSTVVSLQFSAPSQSQTVSVPGSKSYTNRALITAALARGMSRLSRVSRSADSDALIDALRTLGVAIHTSADKYGTVLIVDGCAGEFAPKPSEIDVGPAGTTMRFLTALCSAIPGSDTILKGSERMHQRPIHELVQSLQTLGASISYLGTSGCPPLQIQSSRRLSGDSVTVDGTISSQFISALMLVAPLCDHGLTIQVSGEQISKSYIDMTLQSIADFGVTISNENYKRYVCAPGQSYWSRQYQVEGDASGASYLWGIAALSACTICVENINPDSAQGDIAFPNLLERMGCTVARTPRSISVTGAAELHGIEADMSNMPDTAQTLAVIAACAKGDTKITGLETLRIKETDRIAALHAELAKTGIRSTPGADYIIVHGGSPNGARIATYDDHRMAMSFSLLATRTAGIEIESPEVVNKSFPDFWTTLAPLGFVIR